MFYVYILQSQKDSSYYIGYSSNPTLRLEKHNRAKTGYTARKQPWTLLYTEKANEARSSVIVELQSNLYFNDKFGMIIVL